MMREILGNKLNKTQKIILDSELTISEISEAIREMPRFKTGGLDGLPADFYKVFWIKIKDLLLEVYKQSRKSGILFPTARQGIISLIPKQNKERKFLQHWRPISLLNVDYKILSKAIANRLKIVLPDIIDPAQTGFIKGKDISGNLRLILDIMEISVLRKFPLVMVLVDFEKAFDRVNLRTLFQLMEILNFGPEIIEWSKLLFNEFHLATINSGFLSNFFSPTRGLFQGNPAATYYFLLIGEMLCRMLKMNDKIQGFQLGQIKTLLTQFADDLTLFLKFDLGVWQVVMDTFDQFEKQSGMRISYEKTTIYRIGSLRQSEARFYSQCKIQWTNEPVKVLRLWIDYNVKKMVEMNLQPILDKVETTLRHVED